ncbi:MAG: DUF4468 domain-containing protein [Spirochaetes bacterium]|nr:DUF4468 domain-containing protein [Spirochaetota bacterium]
MMRFIISLLVLVSVLFSCASMSIVPVSQRTKRDILDIPGKTKSIIFNKYLQWLAEKVNKYEIKYKNKEVGKVIWTAIYRFNIGLGSVQGHFTCSAKIKDNSIKIIYKNARWYKNEKFGRSIEFMVEVKDSKKTWLGLNKSFLEYLKNDE